MNAHPTLTGNVQPSRTRLIPSSKLRGTASIGRENGLAVGQATRQRGRPCSRSEPRARHLRSIFTTPSGSVVTAQGVTRLLHPLVQTDMELLGVLKATAQGAAKRPTSGLEHRTLGIRLRELGGNLPLKRATIQSTFLHGEVLHTNLMLQILAEVQNMMTEKKSLSLSNFREESSSCQCTTTSYGERKETKKCVSRIL